MARKPNKMKSEPRSMAKSKAKRSGSKPLAEAASVRTDKTQHLHEQGIKREATDFTFQPRADGGHNDGPRDGCLCRVACSALAMSVSHGNLV
jgi:hypothetical protein